MNKKVMLMVIIAVVLVAFALKVPLQPSYDSTTTDRDTEFKVFGFANAVLIDDNVAFTSPVIKEKPFVLDLDPGEYYWKADNSFLIGKFTIQSEVNVRLEKLEEKYRVHNLGNTQVDLNITRRGFGITGATILDLGESSDLELEDDSVVIASQR